MINLLVDKKRLDLQCQSKNIHGADMNHCILFSKAEMSQGRVYPTRQPGQSPLNVKQGIFSTLMPWFYAWIMTWRFSLLICLVGIECKRPSHSFCGLLLPTSFLVHKTFVEYLKYPCSSSSLPACLSQPAKPALAASFFGPLWKVIDDIEVSPFDGLLALSSLLFTQPLVAFFLSPSQGPIRQTCQGLEERPAAVAKKDKRREINWKCESKTKTVSWGQTGRKMGGEGLFGGATHRSLNLVEVWGKKWRSSAVKSWEEEKDFPRELPSLEVLHFFSFFSCERKSQEWNWLKTSKLANKRRNKKFARQKYCKLNLKEQIKTLAVWAYLVKVWNFSPFFEIFCLRGQKIVTWDKQRKVSEKLLTFTFLMLENFIWPAKISLFSRRSSIILKKSLFGILFGCKMSSLLFLRAREENASKPKMWKTMISPVFIFFSKKRSLPKKRKNGHGSHGSTKIRWS